MLGWFGLGCGHEQLVSLWRELGVPVEEQLEFLWRVDDLVPYDVEVEGVWRVLQARVDRATRLDR